MFRFTTAAAFAPWMIAAVAGCAAEGPPSGDNVDVPSLDESLEAKVLPPTAYPNRANKDYFRTGNSDLVVNQFAEIGTMSWTIVNPVQVKGGGSQSFSTSFGGNGDKPIVGDWDGDGKTDIAVYRPWNSTWHLWRSSWGYATFAYGVAGDIPVTADFDGDGRTDVTIFRPSEGYWYITPSSTGQMYIMGWGTQGDVPLSGDWDGDGKADLAVFRPSNGYWYIYRSSDRQVSYVQWGIATDIPKPGDYDGDGKTDFAVVRRDQGGETIFYVVYSSTWQWAGIQVGIPSDVIVTGDYDGDRRSDIARYRPSEGRFYVRNYWGTWSSHAVGFPNGSPL